MTRFTETELSAVRDAARRTGMSYLEREALLLQAKRQQGEAVARMAAAAGRRIGEVTGLGKLANAVRRRWSRRHTIAALESLDDRMLADIGLTRGSIGAVASDLAGLPQPQPLWRRAVTAIAENRRRAATVRQLRALPDNVLRDLGMERGNIETAVDEAIAQGGYRVKIRPAPMGDFFDQVAASLGLLPIGRRNITTASRVADARTSTGAAISTQASTPLARAANRNQTAREIRAAG